MVWDTPADPDPLDNMGTDIDLHVMHPNGNEWVTGRADPMVCNFINPNPDWGELGRSEDNPSVEFDDDDGSGPEEIVLQEPENTDELGAQYRVGIHYFRASLSLFANPRDYPSTVTVTVYFRGEEVYRAVEVMNATSDFWEPVSISWTEDNQAVMEVNERFRLVP